MCKGPLIIFLTCVLTSNLGEVDAGPLDKIIKEVLEQIKPNLVNLKIDHHEFKSGPQEFGNLEGNVKNVEIKDLDKFDLIQLNTGLININNLTTMHKEFSLKGFYHMNGTLAFPLGKHDINFYGNGEMNVTLTNFTISTALKFENREGVKKVKELKIILNLGGFQAYFKNLMGGGELEEVFNSMMNDVGLTIFNYYKDSVINQIKPTIISKIEELLNPETNNINQEIIKTELR